MQNPPNYLYICSGMKLPSKKGSKRPQRKHSEGTGSGSGRSNSGAKPDSGKISASGKGKSAKPLSGKGKSTEPASRKGRSAERSSGTGRPAERDYGDQIRLNRFIANSGVCSRREADELIRSGVIKVNGKTITELGTRVGPSDSVSYDGKSLRGERKVYVLLNKPKDCVTTVKDTHGRKTVLDLVRGCCSERIYPVGRLDRNTTGVLLLTNDGEMAEALSHPSFNKKKIYHIHLNKNLAEEDMQKLSKGFELEDGFIKPDRIEYVDPTDRRQVGMEVHSGRNRIVRRMFDHLDYKVLRLDRVFYAGLIKKGLSRGHWRHLNLKEVNMLKMSVPHIKSGKRPRKY